VKAALRDRDYLQHILEAIGKIQRFVAGKSEADFFADDMAQDAVIRNLEIIGEAVTKLSPQFKTAHSDVPWGEIAGMRNRLIHGYVSVNMQMSVLIRLSGLARAHRRAGAHPAGL